MNIYDFIRDPYKSVINGYQPSMLDCVARCADQAPILFLMPFTIWFEFKDVWRMEIGDFIKTVLMIPVCIAMPIIAPVVIWPAGIYLYMRLKTYPERRRKAMERQAKLIISRE